VDSPAVVPVVILGPERAVPASETVLAPLEPVSSTYTLLPATT